MNDISVSIKYNKKINLSEAIYPSLLLIIAISILFLIVFIKSRTVPDFAHHPFLYSFTIFVTVFQLSRLVAAIFYKSTLNSVVRNFSHNEYTPNVTFIVPCKNEEKIISNTVSKCFEVNYPLDKVEVIVINDGSTDSTSEVLHRLKSQKYPTLKIIDFEKNRGKRQAMAEGIKVAKGDIIIQLDSDSYIIPSTFKNLIEPFKNPKIGAVSAHTDPENANQNILTRMQAAYYYMSFRIMKAAESAFWSVFCCSGCASAYRKSAILPVLDNWLNEKFLGIPVTYGDDRSLTNWILKSGFKTIYSDKVRAYTVVPHEFRHLINQQLRWKKSWIINAFFASKFIFKNDPVVGIFYFLPLIIISFLTPIVAFSGLIFLPIIHMTFPIYYLLGIFLVTSLFIIYYRYVGRDNKYWPYLYAWQILSMVLLSYLMFYAAVTIKNREWGTR